MDRVGQKKLSKTYLGFGGFFLVLAFFCFFLSFFFFFLFLMN